MDKYQLFKMNQNMFMQKYSFSDKIRGSHRLTHLFWKSPQVSTNQM
jgi:hypothetical protein